MKIRTTTLVSILTVSFPVTVTAQNIESSDKYQISCEMSRECSNFDVMLQQPKVDSEVTQRTRTSRTRENNRRAKVYLGGTLGLTFPGELDELETFDGFDFINGESVPINVEAVDPGTGYIGSLFAGFNFTDSFGSDLELFLFAGGADPVVDSFYLGLGLFANARYTFIFNQDNSKSPYAYVSPGIGLIYAYLSEEIEDNLIGDVDDGVTGIEATGIGLQLKVGVGLPLSETFHFFGQARYFNGLNIFEVEEFNQNSESQGFSSFGLEAGISLNFGQ